MAFTNCYDDAHRADAYSQLEFENTYPLACRDLPEISRRHVSGTGAAVDFGCGTGRSTRFISNLGFETVGIDISPEMVAKARELDSTGDYRVVPGDDFSELPQHAYDLALSLFTVDNIPAEGKLRLLRQLANLLNASGKILSVVSSPEIYLHEWASF